MTGAELAANAFIYLVHVGCFRHAPGAAWLEFASTPVNGVWCFFAAVALAATAVTQRGALEAPFCGG